MKLTLRISLLTCCAALAAFAVEPSAVLFENDQVKVARAMERPHVKGGFHEHKPNRVMVYLQPGQQRFEYQDGRQPAVFDWKVGQVVWSKAEGMHSPEVTSENPFNIIEVELKKPGANKAIKGKLDRKHVTLEFENPQVRVLRVKLGPHEKTAGVGQQVDAVAIYLTAAGDHKMGEAVWQPAGVGTEENRSDQAAEMILVELKN